MSTNHLQEAAAHLMSQLLYADHEGCLPYLDDIAEVYWDDDFSRCKIEVLVADSSKGDLLDEWPQDGMFPLNEQHFMTALSKILHPSGASRNVDRDRFWDALVDGDDYAWMALDTIDASNVLEVVLFGKVLY